MSIPGSAVNQLRTVLTMLAMATVIAACSGDSGTILGTATPEAGQGSSSNEFSPLNIAAAVDPATAFNLKVDLTGTQMLPPIPVAQTARAELTLNTSSNELYGVVDPVVSQVTGVHIHEGAVGEVGSVIIDLLLAADGSGQYIIPQGTVLSDSLADQLVSGNLYIDLHTQQYPDGLLPAHLTGEPVAVTAQSALQDIQATVFTPYCSGCHTGGGQTLPTLMNLSTADASFASLVDVNSTEVPELSRVAPFDPDESYLIRKIEGTQSVGVRMPFRGARLSDEQITSIRQWIIDGAAR